MTLDSNRKLFFFFQNSNETVDEKINEIPGEQVHMAFPYVKI